MDVLLLGCGYTATRVAHPLLARGIRVVATGRRPDALSGLARRGATVRKVDAEDASSLRTLEESCAELSSGFAVLCSVPPLTSADPVAPLLAACPGAGRVVYLSTTSVYGEQTEVDERSSPSPRAPADHLRLAAEAVALGGPWSGLVLRPAAIYGPGRGLHVAIQAGRIPPLDPERLTSRIHVDDLAALCGAALSAEVQGAWPVADDEPAAPRALAALCEELGLPRARFGPATTPAHGGRRVDGRAIRRLLRVDLRYPTYRTGVPAALFGGATGMP